MRALSVIVALGACASGATRPRDPDSIAVINHLDALVENRVAERRIVWKLIRMGDRAVPELRRQLEDADLVRVRTAVFVLRALGHGEEIDRWCRTLSERDLACVRD